MKFGDILDHYIVVKMPLDSYRGTGGKPEGCLVADSAAVRGRFRLRCQEKKQLRRNFRMWKLPFYDRLQGWRSDSPVYVLQGKKLAGGAYLCDRNEVGEPGWGQMHYNWVAPASRQQGVFSMLFTAVMKKAAFWKLDGVVVNTDRHLHPEIYQRWGGQLWQTILKKGPV